MKKANHPAPPKSVQNFPIVGVGASAGGLSAFKSLLKAIPEDSGMAYVLVQHLSPSHESLLPEILQKVTNIPVHEITDDIKLAPNHIYVIPEDKILRSTDGVLKLSARDKKILNLAIDVFFTSLAEVHKEFAAGVVLSGTGTDGTLGLKAIKEFAGICIAQDSESAAFDAMPQHAIDAGVVDFILPPDKIPAQLLLTYGTGDNQNEDGILRQILLIIRQRSNVDFTNYKQATVQRRIARRMVIHDKKDFTEYLSFLRGDKAEQDALFQDMLIPVTAFFRDPKVFEVLCETVFPALFSDKKEGEPIRIWVAGCSTGEEAYSIAICLHEFLQDKFSAQQIQIFASDISKTAINKARAGNYTKADVEMLSATKLATYFTKSNRGYQVSKFIRDVCVFAPHNYLKDPPFSKMDVISCRNSLIYMDAYLQRKALATFQYALRDNGYLVLGKSETASPAAELFTPFKRNENIYTRKAAPGGFTHLPVKGRDEIPARQARIARTGEAPQTDVKKSAETLLLAKFTPASVVVNEQMDVVHIHGDITPYLESPQGKPSFNLLKMAREGLAFELRNALHKATAAKSPVRKEDIPVKGGEGRAGKDQLVCIEVMPLTDSLEPHFLILFTQREAAAVQKALGKTSAKASEIQQKNERLEEELAHTREDMRGVTEDMEAFTEELQSSNEELQSSNEEMQSLNEELETSKEELQSSNEELMIVNGELMDKQAQLSTSLHYSDSIVSTIRGPLIVLDKSLRIKTANASFYSTFNTTEEATEGKFFYEIQNGQWGDTQMRSLLEKILPKKQQLSDYEIRPVFPERGERIILLNARQIVNEKTEEQLILLAIEDVTELSRAEKLLKESEARLRKERTLLHDFFTQAPAMLAILKGPEHVYEFANPAFMEFIGNHDLIGKNALEAQPEIAGQGFIELLNNVYKSGETYTTKEMPVMLGKGNGKQQKFYVNLTYQAFANGTGKTEGILVFAYDVTEQVEARKQVEASEQRFSNILSQSLMNIAIFKGPEMIVEFANEQMLNGLGKGNAVLSKPLLEGVPELKDQVFPKLLADVYTTGVPYEGYETKAVLVRNGIPVDAYFNFVYQPYRDMDNTITGITVLTTEVTEQVLAKKQIEASEAQFRTFADSIQNLAWIAKADGWIYWYNQRWYDYTGTTLEEMEGFGWEKLQHPDHVKKITDFLKAAWKKEEAFELTFPLRGHDGAYRWFLNRVYPVRDAGGNIDRWIGTNTDITEQKSFSEALEKKVEERTAELLHSNEELKQTNRQLDQFNHIASHDLQEPLRKIQTFNTRLQSKHAAELSEDAKLLLDKMSSASSRMSRLIQDVLHYARLLQHENVFAQTNLNETLKDVLTDFELLIGEKGAKISSDSLPTISAIPLQMNQLFYNLLSNALKFSKQDVPPIITIRTHTMSQKEIEVHPALNPQLAYCEIIFKDNGIGFEQQYAQQIFVSFQRLHTQTAYPGTGIGLALVKRIVENQKGEISVESEEGAGTAFSVILPF